MNEPIVDRDPLEVVVESFLERYRAGQRPSVDEYAARHPELADQIRELLQALVIVERDLTIDPDPSTAQPPQAASPSKERRLGDYRILREIGRGGMGVVYEAEQISLGRHVALKVLPGQFSGDRLAQERFRREARAAARLHHTNIVPVFEVGQVEEVCFYAMQFIHGQGLDTVITELRRLLNRARSQSRAEAASGGQSLWSRGARVHERNQAPTLSEGVEVSPVLRYILTGRLDPGGRAPKPGGASSSMLARALAGSPATPTGTETERRAAESDPALKSTEIGSAIAGDATGPERAHLPAPDLSPPASPSSSSAILPGGTQLSSVESGRRAFFRSLAQIGRQVAGGLAYAHARGIVHRDIKPSNLLLDTEGVVWIADFGLAKGEDEGLTQSGDILGTLRYMAPERFRGEGDARADIYALGLSLYELITLCPGFDSSDRLKLIEQIKAEEPKKPRAVDARIPRDLETIVLKAIEKDPNARYQSAEALAEDLRRFLADEPIRARQVTASERYWRWARRNPGIAVLGGVLTVLLFAVTVGSLVAAGGFARSASAERSARMDADQARVAAEKAEAEATEQRIRADHEAEVAQQNLYYAQMNLARQAWREHAGLPRIRELLANWVPEGESPDRRGWEWFYINSLLYQNQRTFAAIGAANRHCSVAWHVPSKRLAAGTNDGLIQIWDVDREQTTLRLSGPGPAGTWWGSGWFAWSPDGGQLAAGFHDGTVHVWDTGSGRELRVFRGQKSQVWSVAYSSDGLRLAAWAFDGTIKIWDASTGRLNDDVAHPAGVTAGAWSPDEKLVASGHMDGTVTVSDAHAGSKIVTLRGHLRQIHALAWSPDGARLAATSQDFTAKVWEIASEKMVLGPLRHNHEITSVAWEPDGKRLATGSFDHAIKIWSADTGYEEITLRGHVETVASLAWAPDGRLASGGDDGKVRIWTSTRDQESRVLPALVSRVSAVSFSPDGKRLASGGDDGKVRIWDSGTYEVVRTLNAHDERQVNQWAGLIRSLAWSPDGTHLASAGLDGTAKVWEAAGGRQVFTLPADHGAVWSVAWSPDGSHLATGSADGTIRVIEGLELIPKVNVFKAHEPRPLNQTVSLGVRTLSWSPQGDRLASGGVDKQVKIWDPVRGAELARMGVDQGAVFSVAWSPDGKRLASAGTGFVIIVWDAVTGQRISTLKRNCWVDAVAWSPDGARLAAAGGDNTVRISDPRNGEEILVLRGNSVWFLDVSWHPDGAQLAAASSDGQIWIWDATRGFERDTTKRALPLIDRKVASGTARGEDRRCFAESYIRAGKIRDALALVKDDRGGLRELLAKLPASEQKAFIQSWADTAKATPPANNTERTELAEIASDLRQFGVATWLWGLALEGDPKLGDDRQAQHRYNAARAAALAAAGQGNDEPPLDEVAKAKLRGQSLGWLRAELTTWAKLLESDPTETRPSIAQTLQHWKQDSALAGVRETEALAKLPPDESKAWQTLWADVDSLLRRLSASKGIDTKLNQSPFVRVPLLMSRSQPVLRNLGLDKSAASQRYARALERLKEILTALPRTTLMMRMVRAPGRRCPGGPWTARIES
jgi:eukaryotic-like serine/threonine-protein kinase